MVLSIRSYGFSYFLHSTRFEVKESIFSSLTKLKCSGDLENPGQFPVLEVL